MIRTTLIGLTIAAATTTSAFAAGNYTTKNDLHRRPVDKIAQELGVQPQDFVQCFVNVRPAKDFKPTKARERANKAVLLPCLQEANPELTNSQLDRVMDKYRGQHIAKR
jgi:hypothetical protein